MSDNPNVSQSDLQQAFESYHQIILPYLGGGGSGGTGFTPVGTVIAYYGETAPAHYLACDGTAYNKADYPELWTHLSSLTDTTAYIVDGNNTKFKVPDLRGEFLRGSGTNGHTNQFTGVLEGSGSNVGQHQDATVFTDTQYIKTNETVHYTNKSAYNTVFPRNPDTVVPSTYFTGNPNAVYNVFSASRIDTNVETLPTSRPTNTSVLFCIAYHDIQIYSVEQLQITVSPNNTYVTIDESFLYQITPTNYLFTFNGTIKPATVPQNTDLLTFNYNNTTGSYPASVNFCANAIPYKAALNTYYQSFAITLKETYNSDGYTNRSMSGSVIFTM